MVGLRRLTVFLAAVLTVCNTPAQVIEFDSGGLKFQALTKNGLTIMIAPLPTHVRGYTVLQVAVSNGGKTPSLIRPDDFLIRTDTGAEFAALPVRTVVRSLIDRASKGDVVKLVTTYENGIYGNTQYKATNGYEQRRQSALAEFTSTKVKAAAAASAIALVQTKLLPGASTDGAVFYSNGGKPFTGGTLSVRVGESLFEFPVVSSN